MANYRLTDKQARFVEEYLKDLNATQAALRAGYNAKTVNKQGPRLLVNAGIQQAIASAQAERSKRTQIDVDRVLLELGRVAFSDFRRLFDECGNFKFIHDIDDDMAAAVSSVEVVEQFDRDDGGKQVLSGYLKKIKLWPKLPANEMLGKHLQMFLQTAASADARLLAEQIRGFIQAAENITVPSDAKPETVNE